MAFVIIYRYYKDRYRIISTLDEKVEKRQYKINNTDNELYSILKHMGTVRICVFRHVMFSVLFKFQSPACVSLHSSLC